MASLPVRAGLCFAVDYRTVRCRIPSYTHPVRFVIQFVRARESREVFLGMPYLCPSLSLRVSVVKSDGDGSYPLVR
jgi:hypothetical protein